jgi:hypothetical protein
MGGNAVRKSAFERVGMYSPDSAAVGKAFCRTKMLSRLRSADIPGMYVPDLIIYHHIPAERLTHLPSTLVLLEGCVLRVG